MSACFVEFKLDFQVHLLKADLPTYKQALTAYVNTVQGAPLDINFRTQRPGIYVIKTSSDKDAKKLENKHVTYYYGKKQDKQVKVKFEKLPKFQIFTDPKWVTIDWVEDSGLRYTDNDFFDNFLKEYGTIIQPTHDDKNEMGMKNGRKKARIDLDKGLNIKRVQWLEADVILEDGATKHVKGKVKIFYSNQPVFCKDCEGEHQGKCPEQIKKEALLKEYEAKRNEQNKALLISDSTFRHANEKALHANTHVVSGAKIGHVNNVIENSELENVDTIIMNVGLNNIDGDPAVNYEKWYNNQKPQLTQLHKNITELAVKGKKSRIIAVSKAPVTTINVKTTKMREAINKFYDTMAKTINHVHPETVSVIHVPEEMEKGIEAYEDDQHITQIETEKILQSVDMSLPQYDLIVKNRPEGVSLSVKKIYSGVYSSYRLGCEMCTRPGHAKESCDLKEQVSNNKRKPSNEGIKETKKINLSMN